MPKITSLEDSRDLSTMKLDDLIGNLKVHKIALKRNKDREQDKKKSLALKASISSDEKEKKKKDKASSSKEKPENLDDIALLVRNFSKFLSNKKFSKNDRFQRKCDYRRGGENRSRKFHKREDKIKKNDDSSDEEEVKQKKGYCYSCGDKDHYANECPKKNKSKKKEKAFIGGAWSASEDEEDDEDICLMAGSDNEVDSYDSNYSSDNNSDDEDLDVLNDSFHKMVILAKNYKDECDKLNETLLLCKKQVHDCKQKIARDFKTKMELNDKVTILEKKLCEKDVCASCVVLNKKIACSEKRVVENDLCAKCNILQDEIACLKYKCDLHEKDDLLAHAFQTSNEKVLKMLKMSNRINCRKGVGFVTP
ncbi:hypothetical protein L6452_31489 [Arctium lappa]|uniref:Uncharacterized protein n=1 Tax=Arctium lappa TaxID=4217 RepID=A0ACB8Z157_ARCLA|nr:hypothetical protein L6452_31489 [Arctium lappa]